MLLAAVAYLDRKMTEIKNAGRVASAERIARLPEESAFAALAAGGHDREGELELPVHPAEAGVEAHLGEDEGDLGHHDVVVVQAHQRGLAAHLLADVVAEDGELVLGGLDLDFLHGISGRETKQLKGQFTPGRKFVQAKVFPGRPRKDPMLRWIFALLLALPARADLPAVVAQGLRRQAGVDFVSIDARRVAVTGDLQAGETLEVVHVSSFEAPMLPGGGSQ